MTHPAETPRTTGAPATGVVLVLTAALVTQTGAALAVRIFDRVGAQGAVFLRLSIAALLLWVVCRPSVRGITRENLPGIVGFGVSLGGMNMCIYQAIARLPLGVAVTIELLGPLVLSVVLSRRLGGVVWAVLALAGVVLLSGVGPGTTALDPVGVGFALAAAALWALYILMSRNAGRMFPGAQGLALGMLVGAVAAAPLGVMGGGMRLLEAHVLLVGAVIAVLSSAVPYALELFALRRLPAATFSVLMSLAPAVAAVVGWLILDQSLVPLDLVGMALVMVASAAAVQSASGAGR